MSELNDNNQTRAELDATEVLKSLLQQQPLPSEPKPEEPLRYEGVYRVTDPAAQTLNCVAIIRGGEIMPLIDLQQLPDVPQTPGGKMHLALLALRAIADGVMEAIEFWELRRQQREKGQDGEGGCCV